MDNIYTYMVKLPPTIHEMVTPCADGYTIYLNYDDSAERQIQGYNHAIRHIIEQDHEKGNVSQIEATAHEI